MQSDMDDVVQDDQDWDVRGIPLSEHANVRKSLCKEFAATQLQCL